MLSIVCVYNDKQSFEGHLLKSLQAQSASCELIALDNSAGAFSSAAAALNHGARKIAADSRHIMFCHQDIELGSPAFLEDLERQLDGLVNLGVAGVAGNSPQEQRLMTNITHGMPPFPAGESIDGPMPAMCVDECCAVIPRQVFERFQFDETVCDSWHAYVVEFCLRVKSAGLAVWVLPVRLHHASLGTLNRSYFHTIEKVLKKHGAEYPAIYTCCGCWHARVPVRLQMAWFYLKIPLYAVVNRLAALGLVPEWLQRKKRRRLERMRRRQAAAMPTQASVAVVVLNWNGFDDTRDCLQSLRQVTYPKFKTVLVDNGSDNSEGRRLQDLFPEVHLIANAANRGFAGGCNDGISWALAAGFDHVALLNNDCLVEKDWLSACIAGLQAAKADFVTARVMYHPETDLICTDGDGLLPDGTGFAVSGHTRYSPGPEVKPVYSVSGAAAVFSRRCLEAVRLGGGQYFDELFFAYFEDIDLCCRLNARGFKGICAAGAVVYHKESRSAGRRSAFQIRQLERNRLLVTLLNFPVWLMPASELYYAAKAVCRLPGKNKRAGRGPAGQAQKFSRWKVLLASRLWAAKNFSAIVANRRERQHKGLIDPGIHRRMCWDLRRLFG